MQSDLTTLLDPISSGANYKVEPNMKLVVLNAVAFAINFIVVGLSNFGVWGRTNADLSDSIPTLVTPIGYAFSIWGVIFISETIFVVWQSLPKNRRNPLVLNGIKYWFAIGCLLQALWSIVFAREAIVLSAIILVLLAVTLGLASIGLSSYRRHGVVDKSDWFFVHFPIGLHAGWLCAASLVNINLAIKYDNGSVPLQVAGAILAIFFSAFFACLFELKFKDSAFLLANAWALYGISVNEDYRNGLLGSDISEGFFIVLNSVWIGLITLTIATFALNRFLKTRH